jgi:hypothetical protein
MPTEPQVLRFCGSWQWLQTSGGFGGAMYTPESTGNTQKAVFSPIGIAKFYRNDTLINACSYTLYKKRLSPDAGELEFVHFNNDPFEKTVHYTGADSMCLSDYACDGFNTFYWRIH